MPSAISISFSPEVEAILLAQAKAQGITVESLVRKTVLQVLTSSDTSGSQQQLSGEAIEQALEDLADLIPEFIPPLSADSLSRTQMYSREDDL